MSRESDEKLLHLYRSYPVLYDEDSPDFNDRKLREHIWGVISQQMGSDTRTCQNNISDILQRYKYERTRNIHTSERSVNHANSWPLLDTCSGSSASIPYTESVCEQMLTEDSNHVLTEDREQGWVYTVGCDNSKVNSSSKMSIKMEKMSKSNYHSDSPQFRGPDKLYPCNSCSEVYHSDSALQLHIQDHTYKCNKCIASFPTLKNLNDHVAKNHRDEHVRQFTCHYCERSFTQQSNLKSHIKTHTGEKPFACPQCPKRFTQSSNLKEHLKIHSGERAHQCSLCPRAFTQSSNLKEHFKTHTGEKPFSCSLCSRKFTQSSNLKEHIKIHTGEKNHVCSLCPRAFTQSSNLKEHLKTHTGEKPFSCLLCPRKFSQSSNLKEHMKIHANERDHVCDICDKGFIQLSNLRAHMMVHRREESIVDGESASESSSKMILKDDRSFTTNNMKTCAGCKRVFLRFSNLEKHIASSKCHLNL